MGYFKRKIRRVAATTEKGGLLQPTRSIDPRQWTSAPAESTAIAATYFRLRIQFEDGHLSGFFKGIGHFLDDVLTPVEVRRVFELGCAWFNRNMPVPRQVTTDAVFWFRADGPHSVEQLWHLIRAVRRLPVDVLIERTHHPGRIVYRDEWQVGAIRFADAPFIQDASEVIDSDAPLLDHPAVPRS